MQNVKYISTANMNDTKNYDGACDQTHWRSRWTVRRISSKEREELNWQSANELAKRIHDKVRCNSRWIICGKVCWFVGRCARADLFPTPPP